MKVYFKNKNLVIFEQKLNIHNNTLVEMRISKIADYNFDFTLNISTKFKGTPICSTKNMEFFFRAKKFIVK